MLNQLAAYACLRFCYFVRSFFSEPANMWLVSVRLVTLDVIRCSVSIYDRIKCSSSVSLECASIVAD